MTTKERLLQELDNAPEELLEAVLRFVLTAKENVHSAQIPVASTHDQTKLVTDKSIWEIAQDLTSDMTAEEIAQLPKDGAEQHDHYIYGTPKRST